MAFAWVSLMTGGALLPPNRRKAVPEELGHPAGAVVLLEELRGLNAPVEEVRQVERRVSPGRVERAVTWDTELSQGGH